MRNIRFGIYETASSAVHALIMCSGKEYEELEHEELLITGYNNGVGSNLLIPRQEALILFRRYYMNNKDWMDTDYSIESLDGIPDDQLIEMMSAEDFAFTLDNFGDDCGEPYEEFYTTPKGETVVAFGYVGRGD